VATIISINVVLEYYTHWNFDISMLFTTLPVTAINKLNQNTNSA